jgi:GNAT superfamily N-acetyltransferase
VLVAVCDHRIIACVQLTIIPGLSRIGATRAQLEGVRVHRDFRSRGIGAALIAEAVDRARRAGCSIVQLTTDRRRRSAHRFYASLGFHATHLGMKLELPRAPRWKGLSGSKER